MLKKFLKSHAEAIAGILLVAEFFAIMFTVKHLLQ